MRKYRKKPVVVEAQKYVGLPHNCRDLHEWMGVPHGDTNQDCDKGIYIDTLEGLMEVNIGDYIIKGVAGEFYPCHPDIFHATYEEVTNADCED